MYSFEDVAQVIRFDVLFTLLSAVFGSACKKHIPLSVMVISGKSMERCQVSV